MYEIGEQVQIIGDHRFGFIYATMLDCWGNDIYKLVWNKEDLNIPWEASKHKSIFWGLELKSDKVLALKNGKRIYLSK